MIEVRQTVKHSDKQVNTRKEIQKENTNKADNNTVQQNNEERNILKDLIELKESFKATIRTDKESSKKINETLANRLTGQGIPTLFTNICIVTVYI